MREEFEPRRYFTTEARFVIEREPWPQWRLDTPSRFDNWIPAAGPPLASVDEIDRIRREIEEHGGGGRAE